MVVFLVVIANQIRSFREINQSDCEKGIDNAYPFFMSRSWSRSEKISTTSMRHHSGQNLLRTHSAAPRQSTTL